ncbi:hypothetical protein [Rhizobium mongolense]|uniref:Transposase n=2 Tax=Rhizobium mongolense TaxID=57676 RepID=A0ABR6IQQ6_9HYPH|nr:hypothetical protein [Rhizobium mongolense]MBB4230219.1 hypothetical protein [Rhizobium mongolense]TVZ65701.1 hypothetical protein BCL32_6022 [Rhizobium mongolense USDA 1844]
MTGDMMSLRAGSDDLNDLVLAMIETGDPKSGSPPVIVHLKRYQRRRSRAAAYQKSEELDGATAVTYQADIAMGVSR